MSRSSKKGPFIDERLLGKIHKQKVSGDKTPIKTWSRSCVVSPDFVGHTFMVHQGKNFVEVFVNESMVGHKLGEFAPTRTFRGHGKVVKRVLTKT
jgi:small subunit ribosomal protein S19